MKTYSSAFSLIELMVVVAIIAILSSLAVPAYQRYVQQARVTEALNHTQSLQLAMALCWQTEGDMRRCSQPGQRGVPAIPDPLPNALQSLEVSSTGVIQLTLADVLVDQSPLRLSLSPDTTGLVFNWRLGCADFSSGQPLATRCVGEVAQ
ncbi:MULTISPECIES: prepilin-type N-terminal cleavage/methylation domain-containing protein [unclassified Idiomarina]|jgi:prepilin peptidase dependent protein D|uniref:pilin n=1 Tax=unclassified Idiomarina TaxID=2614829 RepID=UPI000C8F77E8|nr:MULTISPECIES: prepilin-type N-terminal cleavage/methylation domain-containing protein [unclassified Idiomarina]MAD52591.1 pilus assembly protein PilA [Idiomarinaceae bacterium]MEC7643286.1 prepilin-type N-terminal cleavage/methylation domain-containing protein [Pseudomonadota bacterium]NQZ03335.1 prepilin-type N-terminal cleavage/methylation domain-containing protein [Idiomarina sp.]